MTNANKDGTAENLIPLARDVAENHCRYWVIENKPRAPLKNATRLDGKMFGLTVEHERAFESNFKIKQPPRQAFLPDTETSTYFHSGKSIEWWASVKGVDASNYTKQSLAKNCLPAAYVHHIMRSYLRASEQSDGPTDYTDYDKRKTTQKRLKANQSLQTFVTDGGN
jgi:hypothetical protein